MKGLHKNSLRKVDNPHQWMIDDARMELLQQIKTEIIKRIDKRRLSEQAKNEFVSLLHFLDTLQEQPVCEGLEEEIERYIPTSLAVKFPTTDIETIKSDIRYIARHFAQWQKEQMLKEAVEGKIIFLFNGDVAINIGDTDKYKLGDNVRIVIVKED